MIVRNEPLKIVKGIGFTSLRYLLANDGLGFSLHKTVIPKGEPRYWHYKEHLEACFCVYGKGIIKDIKNDIEHSVEPDTIYILNNHDAHEFTALEDTVLISVFNPPVYGNEVHDNEGSYLLPYSHNKDLARKIVESVFSVKNNYDAMDLVQDILNNKI